MQIETVDYLSNTEFRLVDGCSEFRLSEVNSLNEVIQFIQTWEQKSSHYFLATFDDINQASYTSMHASQDESIYLDMEIDWDNKAQVQQYDIDKQRHIETVLQQQPIAWSEMINALPISAEDLAALIQANENPDLLIDDVVYVQRAHVSQEDLKIAALPNGYFSCDLNVFQNHCLIKKMVNDYGYYFLGLGASWLVFYRQYPVTIESVINIIQDLKHCYGEIPECEAYWQKFQATLLGKTTLVIGYTENFAESF